MAHTNQSTDNELTDLIREDIQHLSKMINSTPSCLKIINAKGELLNMNPVGLELIGAKNLESVLGANIYTLLDDAFKKEYVEFNKRICSGETGTMIFKIIGLHGSERWLETFSAPYVLNNNEVAHIAITNDITQRVKAENELKQKDQALEEAARLSALGEFAAGIAHEINNPLAIIMGKSQLIMQRMNQDLNEKNVEAIKNNLQAILDTTVKTSEIIKNLKSYSRVPDFNNLKWYSLAEIISTTTSLCSEKFKKYNIQLESNIDQQLNVLCQKVGLSQVIMNLLNNSFDAISNLPEKWIKIEHKLTKKQLKIIITDSGTGINQNIKSRILQPFFTTKEAGTGTGLGLSISSNLMKKMNGKIYLNDKNRNTQFILELPDYKISNDQ